MSTFRSIADDLEEAASMYSAPGLFALADKVRALDPSRRTPAGEGPLAESVHRVMTSTEQFRQIFATGPYPEAAVKAAKAHLEAVQSWADTRREIP